MDNREYYSRLGSTIKQRREMLALTQLDFAKRIETSRPNLANIERGKQRIHVMQLHMICTALDVPLEQCFNAIESKTP